MMVISSREEWGRQRAENRCLLLEKPGKSSAKPRSTGVLQPELLKGEWCSHLEGDGKMPVTSSEAVLLHAGRARRSILTCAHSCSTICTHTVYLAFLHRKKFLDSGT